MAERVQLSSSIIRIKSGCTLLDCVLGGGYGQRKIINIVGDKSTGKSLLAIEAAAHFLRNYKNGIVRYTETEEAFDPTYVKSLGIQVEKISLEREIRTVELWFEDLQKTCVEAKKNSTPVLYILDSLDGLSDAAEMERPISEGSYGAAKARKLSELFRRITKDLSFADVTLIVISQVRENIGVTFGEKYSRSGGKALDFFASQIVWLSEKEKMKRAIDGAERVVGFKVKALGKKNRLGAQYRDCEFPLLFNYGVDDFTACVEWLITLYKEPNGYTKDNYKTKIALIKKKGQQAYRDEMEQIQLLTETRWQEIEAKFKPPFAKYP
jgi:recombination protein RecA